MADQEESPKISIMQRLINFKDYITVEPVVAAWIIPACILIIASENLNLEKVFLRCIMIFNNYYFMHLVN